MEINITYLSLYANYDLKSEKKIQSVKTRALINNLKDKEGSGYVSDIMVFSEVDKKYMKSMNTKFAFLSKYIRYNFKKEEVMVFIKQQKYQHIVCKIKKGIIYFILDMKTILFICKTPKNEDY